jgi:cytochrome P450
MALYWDPFDTAIDESPYEIWTQLRDDAPVYRNDALGFYALSRFDDVQAAHRLPAVYCSSHGIALEIMSDRPMQSGMMIMQDPPEHTELRSLVTRAFTPSRVAQLEARIRGYCHELLAAWQPGEEFDYVQQFCAPLPSMVISELLGVPAADRGHVREQIDLCFHHDADKGMINDTSIIAMAGVHGYMKSLIEKRANKPGDDMLSALTVAEIDDHGTTRRLTVDEATDFAVLLVTAGTETVGKLLSWGAILLGEHLDQQQSLRENPSAIPNAVEELFRYEAPSPVQGRYTKQDVTLHDTTIPAGSKVLLLTGSAGRDERKYGDTADVFNVHREFDHHLSLGFGIHFCLGASLARLEGRIGLEESLKHTRQWTSDRQRSSRVFTSTVRGWKHALVTAD